MQGFILINKPTAVTSFHVTACVRKKLGLKRVGHAGTLDPLATGVLPIMIGQTARLIELLPVSDKRYKATFRLGITTDTLDITGKVLSELEVDITSRQVKEVLMHFRGEIMQIPPMFSAISKDGVRLYQLARQGIEIVREARKTTIYALELIGNFDNEYIIDVRCSKGTYIRTLIDDIGKMLGCGAVMTELERTEGNGFSVKNCVSLEQFMAGETDEFINAPDQALLGYSEVTVTKAQETRFSNGGALDLIRLTLPENHTNFIRVYGKKFLGLGEIDLEKQQLMARCVLNEE